MILASHPTLAHLEHCHEDEPSHGELRTDEMRSFHGSELARVRGCRRAQDSQTTQALKTLNPMVSYPGPRGTLVGLPPDGCQIRCIDSTPQLQNENYQQGVVIAEKTREAVAAAPRTTPRIRLSHADT
ncbi:hypothetical protein Q5P01_000915 [Channa striata]|uniref:Uncharacterized protein n=1 Tax=Channa striata TaxID=64152 RepID=A0AA88ICW0_CHASR|nr:hypothetical protein Q5P01_000915 [Channa striata]